MVYGIPAITICKYIAVVVDHLDSSFRMGTTVIIGIDGPLTMWAKTPEGYSTSSAINDLIFRERFVLTKLLLVVCLFVVGCLLVYLLTQLIKFLVNEH